MVQSLALNVQKIHKINDYIKRMVQENVSKPKEKLKIIVKREVIYHFAA